MSDTAPTPAVCRHCRRELPEHARFCPECGYTTARPDRDILKPIGLTLLLFGALLLLIPGGREN